MKTTIGNAILDIHTHRVAPGDESKSIINYDPQKNSTFQEKCHYSIGIHPWSLTDENFNAQIDFLEKHLSDPQVVAVGEAGFDKSVASAGELQLLAMTTQAIMAETYELPMIIHCVKELDRLLSIRKHIKPKQPWIWHGFRGKPEMAQQVLKLGFYLSLGEHYHEETMRLIPDGRLFIETDESLLGIEDILQRAAQVRGVETETLRDTIARNVQNVFFKA